jgi:polysaccharide deacetylase family protein (PEP-CTERM system associated)
MSVDVEDWFQVENLRPAIPRDTWDERELRVEGSTRRVLEILAEHDTRATFFVLGWLAERLPHLVREIRSHGHEIACHGYGHQLLYDLSAEAMREDIHRAKSILEDITGEPVVGYRAPSFSITDAAIDELSRQGFRYDSSLFPSMAHDRYGKLEGVRPDAPPTFRLREGFEQVSLSCLHVMGRRVPWAGGGYFRLLPYEVFRRGVARILEQQGQYTFYVHPWEFDPGQPRVSGIRASHRFRHYNNLDRTQSRFERLVSDFRFQPIRDALSTA